jgi:hypothetical protein
MQRQSLLDGDDFSSIGSKGGKGAGGARSAGGMPSDKVLKLAIAVVLFFAAGGLLAYHFGVFGGAAKDPHAAKPPTQQQVREREQRSKEDEAEIEQLQREGKATVGGA